MAEEFNTEGMLDMYLFENEQLLEQLQETVLEQKDAECFDEDSINEIFRTMHTIKGSSGIMMFDNITAVSHKLEDVFYYLRESHPENVPHLELVEHVLEVEDFISSEMEKIRNGDSVDGDASDIIKNLDKFLDKIKNGMTEEGAELPPENVHEEPKQFYIAPVATSASRFYKIYITFFPETEMSNVHAYKTVYALKEIKDKIHIPLIADIHFDYKMAIAAIENGADKIRINPGNIGSRENVAAVVAAAKERNIPIRVGVNSGSLERELVEKYHGVTAQGIVESALDKVRIIEELGYDNLVISIKSSDVMMCVKAHELLAEQTTYPLHVGITESGTVASGNIKSAIGLGIILNQGIGDTIRVSLTGDPVEEIRSARLILRTLGLRKGGIEVVSCPTCGRTKIDLIGLANQVETMAAEFPLDIKVAVMGCAVNGPGEAKEADIGIAGGDGEGLLIKRGEIVRKVPEDKLLATLREELENWEK